MEDVAVPIDLSTRQPAGVWRVGSASRVILLQIRSDSVERLDYAHDVVDVLQKKKEKKVLFQPLCKVYFHLLRILSVLVWAWKLQKKKEIRTENEFKECKLVLKKKESKKLHGNSW